MQKSSVLLLSVVLAAMLFGCGHPSHNQPVTTAPSSTAPVTEPVETLPNNPQLENTQPEVTEPLLQSASLYGIDVTGMSAQEAKDAIRSAIAEYNLTITVNNRDIQIPGETLSITLSDEAFDSWFQQTVQGIAPPAAGIISFKTDAALDQIRNHLESSARNAAVVFNANSQQFEIQPHRDGISVDLRAVEPVLRNAVSSLSPTAAANATVSSVAAAIVDTDIRLPAAVAAANDYLKLDISYTYEAPGITTTTKALKKADIADFVTFDKNFHIVLSSKAIKSYVKRMSQQFGNTYGDFRTTHGTTVDLTVKYYGAVLDQDGMYDDLYSCLEKKISGNRTAPFLSSSANNMPYGGNYVEIDLTSQYLWLYKNGELVISTPFVSGNVSGGRRTPTGVFSIFGMYTDTYLMGPTWYDYVNYWIPFYGGIGLHDASWRDEFGGSIYMYNGSHGCINLPNYAAGVIYDNVSLGTMVIVYGGVRSVGNMEQVLAGTESYHLAQDSAPFSLNVTPKYNGVTFHYSSSDENVVTVDDNGLVTVVGPGAAEITVTTDAISVLSAGKLVISVTVEDSIEPEPTDPEETQPETTDPEETEPEITEPEITEPEESDPEITEPEATSPEEVLPSETAPESAEPPKQESAEVLKFAK